MCDSMEMCFVPSSGALGSFFDGIKGDEHNGSRN